MLMEKWEEEKLIKIDLIALVTLFRLEKKFKRIKRTNVFFYWLLIIGYWVMGNVLLFPWYMTLLGAAVLGIILMKLGKIRIENFRVKSKKILRGVGIDIPEQE